MTKLKRELKFAEVLLTGVGIIVGAGIYALVGKAAGISGTAAWLSFAIAALVAGLTGLSYAELVSMYPKAGAEYVYTKHSFGKRVAFLVGWLIIFSGVISAATVALGFAGYFEALTGVPQLFSAPLCILLLSSVIFYGMKESARAAIIGTLIEVGGLVFIVALSIPSLGAVDYFQMPSIGGVLSGAALVFFAFIGFEEIARLSEETKSPKKVMPRAILGALAISTILYILVAVSAVSVISPESLGASSAPLAEVAGQALGESAYIFLIFIALFATLNTVLLIMVATSRITYGMAVGHSLPSALKYIHPVRRTPWAAIALVTVLSMLFTFAGKIDEVAYLTDFGIFFTFIIVNSSLVYLRFSEPDAKRPFRVPISVCKVPVLPVLGVLTSLVLVASMPFEIIIFGAVLALAGILVYEIFKKF